MRIEGHVFVPDWLGQSRPVDSHCWVSGHMIHRGTWLPCKWQLTVPVGLQFSLRCFPSSGHILCLCHWILWGHVWDLELPLCSQKHLSSRNMYNLSSTKSVPIQKQDLWLLRQQILVSDLIFQKSQVVVTLVYPGPPKNPRARDLYVAGLPTLETVVLPGN